MAKLREQLVKVHEREKKELVHSSQEQQLKERVKELEIKLRESDSSLVKQYPKQPATIGKVT